MDMFSMRSISIASVIVILFAIGIYFVWDHQSEPLRNYPPRGNRVVAFGDSLTQGVGSNTGGYVSLLSKNFGIDIVNAGISGDTTEYAIKRLSPYLGGEEGQSFDIAIVLLGGNDALRGVPVDETFSNLRIIIEQFQESGALVVLVGIQGGVLGDKYASPFDKLAKEMGVVYVPDVLDGVIGVSNLMSDTVHPNDRGYLIVAKRIAEKLGPVLKAASK